MTAISFDPRLGGGGVHMGSSQNEHGGDTIIEVMEGVIRVYKDGHVERQPLVPNVSCTVVPCSEVDVICRDVIVDKFNNVWARVYVPNKSQVKKLPLFVYFHGGGFCVGSASWICYHNFLAKLACKAACVIMSVNYRLAPENRLPAAYDDGVKTIMWVKQEAIINGSNAQRWWWGLCDFSNIFLSGDSAGANIAHNVSTRLAAAGLESSMLSPLSLKGIILIQPFFGGEGRTHSERYMVQHPKSALSLAASDVYWRLSLPLGTNRDHPWCNPLLAAAKGRVPAIMVFVSDLDILKDRNMEFCNAMRKAGNKVEHVVCMGVGHAFQVLDGSQLSQIRTQEMISHIKAFINR